MSTRTISAQAAQFIAELSDAQLPADVAEKVRSCILYGFGIGLLCVAEKPAIAADRATIAIDGEAARGGATSLVSGRAVPVSSAAFTNAVLLHSRCQEDTSGTAHLGVVVLPVAMALVESGLARMDDLVCGIVAGYEFAGLMESAFGRDTMPMSFRPSQLYGTLAAEATAARMLRLPPERIDAALANAASFTGGLLESVPEGTDEWRYQVGIAARTGLVAACLANEGSVSAKRSIEGGQGFASAFARRAPTEGELRFGEQWKLRDVTFKPFPVCAHNQTLTLIGAQAHGRVRHEDIASMTLRINPYLVPGMLSRGPFSRVSETLMSAYFCCASACVHGTVSLAQLGNFGDPAVEALMQRMAIEVDAEVAFPSALARIETKNGQTIALAEQRKFAELSLGRADVNAQMRRLAAEEGIPAAAMEKLDAFAFGVPRSDFADVRTAFEMARRARL